MFKKILIANNFKSRITCFLTILIISSIVLLACNPVAKTGCKNELLSTDVVSSLVYLGGDATYFLRSDTSKHFKSNLYNQIANVVKKTGLNPRECAIQWGLTSNNEILIFAGVDKDDDANTTFCSLLDQKKELLNGIDNINSFKLIFLYAELTWKKDSDGFAWPYIKGELKGLKEL